MATVKSGWKEFFYFMRNMSRAQYIVNVAILSALAGVLMLIEFPLFVAPAFYKVDLSDVAVLIGGFALGAPAAILISFMKVLISIILDGTSTAFVGEFAAFIMDSVFGFVASFIYQKQHTKKGAIKALVFGVLALTVTASFVNYFLMIPAYVKFMNFPLEAILALGNAVNKGVNSLFTLIVFCTIPFNIIKGLIVSVVTYLLYKRISPILKR